MDSSADPGPQSPADNPEARDTITPEEKGQAGTSGLGAGTSEWNYLDVTASFRAGGSDSSARRKTVGGAAGASSVVDLEQFVHSVVEIGLLEAGEVREFLGRLPQRERPTHAEDLARELVRARRLSDYQAGAILQGKTKGLVIGNYLVLDKLGAGGMGMVFKAEHRLMKRVVALKLLPPSFTRDESFVHRFRREAEAAARLSHPNIVAALDAGEFKGLHFFVMEFVEGSDLSRLIREKGPLPVDQAVACVIQAARGLQAAHARGIFHRDIKPSNLLLDTDGTVKVLDLGLARLDEDPSRPGSARSIEALTNDGAMMGTVEFMSPEQAYDSRSVDKRSDIYSLGCTLYYLLIGVPPYRRKTVMACALAHREQPIPRLRNARPDVPPALDDALRLMLAKEPEQRYQSIDSLIADLEACRLKPVPELVSPRGPRSRRRVVALVALAAGSAASIAIGLASAGRPRSTPVPVVRVERGQTDQPQANHAPHPSPIPRGAPPPAIPPSRVAAEANPEPRVAPSPLEPPVEILKSPGSADALVSSVAASSDGRHALSGGNDHAVRYWDVARREEICSFRHDGPVFDVAFSPDNRTALSASHDKTARLWDVATGAVVVRFAEHKQPVYAVAIAPDGQRALTGGGDHFARLWDLKTGAEVRQFPHEEPVVAVAFSPDGRSILTASGKAATRWEIANGTGPELLEGRAEVLCVAFAPGGRRVASGAKDGSVTLWDLDRRTVIGRVEEPGNWVRSIGFLPGDRRRVLAGTWNGNLILWDLEAGRAVARIRGDAGHLGLAVLPDGAHALTSDDDGHVRLWRLPEDGARAAALEGPGPSPSAAASQPRVPGL
jgi:serine/threonine protein kinase